MHDDSQILNIEGHPLRNPFWRELDEGLITYRDSLQFELKSDFFINPQAKTNTFTQEFYIFIPETLQINPSTYTTKQFYLNQTSLIRYKTPFMTLEEIIDPLNKKSPLVRIQTSDDKEFILRELMLLGNIFRSTLRTRVRRLMKELEKSTNDVTTPIATQVQILCTEIMRVRERFKKAKDFFCDRFEKKLFIKQISYIDEFMSQVIDEFMTLFLSILRNHFPYEHTEADQAICQLLVDERNYRRNNDLAPPSSATKESILYRQGLIEKFMISVLKLQNTRVQTREKHAQLIGVAAAGIAMFVYMILFLWGATNFVTNSAPFVMLAVIFYILKDRIKEGLKNYYHRKASVWFPDYSTKIQSPHDDEVIGELNESFTFLSEEQLPREFRELRYKNDDDELVAYQPLETIIQYKKEVILKQRKSRLNELNTIFRLNIHRFLEKANDAIQPTLRLNSKTLDLKQEFLPKVYHINIILKSTYIDLKQRPCKEIKKFRVIIDKDGIRRVEHVTSQFSKSEKMIS